MKIKVLMLTLGVLSLPVLISQTPRLTEETEVVKVTQTFVKDNKYLVYTDIDTFEVDDSFAYFKFFPDEDWSKIIKNKCYEFTTIGFRVKIPMTGINTYENVVNFKEVTCK